MAASIDHPNVIPVHGAGDAGGTLFIAMRYVDGTDLRALLRSQGRLEPSRAADLVRRWPPLSMRPTPADSYIAT